MAPFRVIAITDGGDALAEKVRALLGAGVEVLVREPQVPKGIPLERVILHAKMEGAVTLAHTLHLGAGANVALFRSWFAGPMGMSCHDPEEAAAARAAGAAYTFLSPIFAPRHGRPARGLPGLTGCIALGGVTPDTVSMCRAAGAVGVAVMGGIWHAPDPVSAARAYLAAVSRSS